jgi:DNA-binding NarL/FixJ family response regulator
VTSLLATGEIRVAIVSGQRVFSEALAIALDDCPNIALDAVVDTVDDEALKSRRIGIILLDFEGLGTEIEPALSELRRSAPHPGVIVLSSRTTGDAPKAT